VRIRFLLALVAVLSPAAGESRSAPNPRETPVVRAVRKASPAVVNISIETVTRTGGPFGGVSPFFDEFFKDFFGDRPGFERRERSLGSGVIIGSDGLILTNEHVIGNATKIVVTRVSGEEYQASLVGADNRTDLAVLRVEVKEPLPHLEMGNSSDLMIGETVIAIGNPFGLSHTVTTGVVSAVNRTIRGSNDQVYTDFIQTDASINPGNSGGPLLNILGDLIGINTAIYQRAEGIGFAIPIDKAKRIVGSLITYGKVHRAWLGVFVQDLNPELARHFGVESKGGVLVGRVFEKSPAAEAGIERGDVLLALDGLPIKDRDGFFERLAGYTSGSTLRIRVARRSQEKDVTVAAREIPDEYVASLSDSWLGLRVAENSKAAARQYELATSRGLVITEVRGASAAAKAGIQAGDVVRQVNGDAVDSAEEYKEAVLAASERETVVLVIQRGQVGYYVTLSP
jgi:serine protease Do